MKTRLKDARKATGISQQDACVKFGVSLGTYRNWEQGRVVMNGEQLITAARLYNTTVDYLLMTDSYEVDDEMEDNIIDLYRSMNDEGRRVLSAIAEALGNIYGNPNA